MINSAKKNHFFQSSYKYEQYIHKYCFIIMFMFVCCSWTTMLYALSVFMNYVFVIHFMNHVLRDNYQFFSFIYSAETDCEEWSSWNSFIKINMFFFIIMYDSHVLYLYSSHLIRSSNHVNFIFYFILLIKLTKYRSSSFSIIINYDSDTYLLIRLSFENYNKLIWNIEWTFISDDNSSSYV